MVETTYQILPYRTMSIDELQMQAQARSNTPLGAGGKTGPRHSDHHQWELVSMPINKEENPMLIDVESKPVVKDLGN